MRRRAYATTSFDFSGETVGAVPKSFTPVGGKWKIADDAGNKVLVVDCKSCKAGFPYAVANGISDFKEGDISLRFKTFSGYQAIGIVFDLKSNGDYLVVRTNAAEKNLNLYKVVKGVRSSITGAKNVPAPSNTYNTLRVSIQGTTMTTYVNGKLYLTYKLPAPASGKVGVWSKDDTYAYVDDVVVKPSGDAGGGGGTTPIPSPTTPTSPSTPTAGLGLPSFVMEKNFLVGAGIIIAGLVVMIVAAGQGGKRFG